jgi:exodeoxyribonuclease VII large subunit
MLGRRRVALDTAAVALPQLATTRVRRARSDLDAAGAELAVLDPQRTLERGYAIVRRATDGAIVRAPAEAPPATPLRLRVAEGDIAATVDTPS